MKPRCPTLRVEKKRPAARVAGSGPGVSKPQARSAPGGTVKKNVDHGRGKRPDLFSVISLPKAGHQLKNLTAGAEETGVARHPACSPGIFVVHFPRRGASGNETRLGGGVQAVFGFRFSVFGCWISLGRLGQGDEAQGGQPQGPVYFFPAKLIQIPAAEALHHRRQQHKTQVAVEGCRVRGVFQGRGRGQARQKGRAGSRRGCQQFLIKGPPGRQPGAVGEKTRQGQGALVRRQPWDWQNLSQRAG